MRPDLPRGFPEGGAAYRDPAPKDKPVSIEILCALLETNTHPMFPPEAVTDATTRLRAAAAALQAVNDQVLPRKTSLRVLTSQFASNARRTQTQLSRMKKRMKSDGLTEHDVHLIIPAAQQRRRAKTVTDLTPDEILDATFGDVSGAADEPTASGSAPSDGSSSEEGASSGTTASDAGASGTASPGAATEGASSDPSTL